ncbi:unnamed protein product [Pleuronectes platessa]|uniref:Uncharacterized protein n=1 Tax=Pleuronectes platessa TaxID=8262 RepID=A0A9N7YZ16_PLEPL|nr:unnamed protein product [Pleuronectes platessa]
MSCSSAGLSRKSIFEKIPESRRSQKTHHLSPPLKNKDWRKRRRMKSRWLLVFPGSRASNGGRLVGAQAAAVRDKPAPQRCCEATPVPAGGVPRAATASHDRTGLTSIGLGTESAPIKLLRRISFWGWCRFSPGGPATLPGHNQSHRPLSPRARDREKTTDEEAPSLRRQPPLEEPLLIRVAGGAIEFRTSSFSPAESASFLASSARDNFQDGVTDPRQERRARVASFRERQICTCNQSPVDTGLITDLIWHPAAFSLSSHEPHAAERRRGAIMSIADFLIPSVSAVTCNRYWVFYPEARKVRTQPGNRRLCGPSGMSCSLLAKKKIFTQWR